MAWRSWQKLDGAIARFRTALQLRPDDPDTLYYLGCALLKNHAPLDAATALQHALQVNPQDSHARNALAVALAETKNLAAAKAQLQQALAREPENPMYQRNLSCLEREMQECALDF
jgi:Flp pilus assembly protein TadD